MLNRLIFAGLKFNAASDSPCKASTTSLYTPSSTKLTGLFEPATAARVLRVKLLVRDVLVVSYGRLEVLVDVCD